MPRRVPLHGIIIIYRTTSVPGGIKIIFCHPPVSRGVPSPPKQNLQSPRRCHTARPRGINKIFTKTPVSHRTPSLHNHNLPCSADVARRPSLHKHNLPYTAGATWHKNNLLPPAGVTHQKKITRTLFFLRMVNLQICKFCTRNIVAPLDKKSCENACKTAGNFT